MTSSSSASADRIRWVGAIGSLAIVLVFSGLSLKGRGFVVVASESRRDEVDRAFSSVPLALGPWLGSDVPLPAGAKEVLHATGTLSRRYVRIGSGADVTVAIVHCGDVRDMLGHYPPSCYPSQGWQLVGASDERFPLNLRGQPGTAAIYRFEKPGVGGGKSSLSVAGSFLLPGEPSTPEVARLRGVARDRFASAQGVGQIQIIFAGSPDVADMRTTVQDLLDSFPPELLEVLLRPDDTGGPE